MLLKKNGYSFGYCSWVNKHASVSPLALDALSAARSQSSHDRGQSRPRRSGAHATGARGERAPESEGLRLLAQMCVKSTMCSSD